MIKILVIKDEPESGVTPWQACNVDVQKLLYKIHTSLSTNIQKTRDLNTLLTFCLSTLEPEEIQVLCYLELSDVFNSMIIKR